MPNERSPIHRTQLAAEVLHELRQPLVGIKAYAQLMSEEASVRTLPLLLQQVERMERIISDFLRLASNQPEAKQKLSLAAPVEAAVRHFDLTCNAPRISLETDLRKEVQVQGSARLLEQLAFNLISNAKDALGGKGRLKVVVGREGSQPVLYVADWGIGIAPHLREKIFEPYVSARAGGSGLGLSVCQRIAQEHGAQIDLAPPELLAEQPPPATVFRVRFPGEVQAAPAKRRLLVVDDESIIRLVFQDLMGRECEVLEAETAEEGLQKLADGPVDLIVTDKNLPGLSGLELAQEARKLNPASKVILMTGYPSLVTAQQAVELGLLDYLLKPFDDIREVRTKIRQALEAKPLERPVPEVGERRVHLFEDNPASARQVQEALSLLGLRPVVHTEVNPGALEEPYAGVVVSWDFTPAHGKAAVELGQKSARGLPFVVLAEHLTMDAALESLRGGAAACLPKLLTDVKALSRELARALKVPLP